MVVGLEIKVKLFVECLELQGTCQFGVTHTSSFFSFAEEPHLFMNIKSEVGNSDSFKLLDVPQLSDLIRSKLRSFVKRKLVYPSKHQFRLAWPRAWWPKGTEHFYSGSSETSTSKKKGKEKEKTATIAVDLLGEGSGDLRVEVPETPIVDKSNGSANNIEIYGARSDGDKSVSSTPGGVLYTPSSAGILSPEVIRNATKETVGTTDDADNGHTEGTGTGRRNSKTREAVRHASLTSDTGRDSVYGDEFHTVDRESTSSLRDSFTVPLEGGDNEGDDGADDDGDIRMSAYGNSNEESGNGDGEGQTYTAPANSIRRFFSTITSTSRDDVGATDDGNGEDIERQNSRHSPTSDSSPSSYGNRSRLSSAASNSSDLLKEYYNSDNPSYDTNKGGSDYKGGEYPSELTEEMLEAARKHMAEADAVCVYDSDDSYEIVTDDGNTGSTKTAGNDDDADDPDADDASGGNGDVSTSSLNGSTSGTSTPLRSRGVSNASLTSDVSDVA